MEVMAVESDYVISPTGWVRDQTERILETGTTEGVHVKGSPVVLITMVGAKSGRRRLVPLMRVEDDGNYAIVFLSIPWSMHHADGTYLLAREGTGWRVILRQFVYYV